MVIQYLGEGCFRLQSGETSILVNPSSNRLKADVVLKTIALANEEFSPEEISFPGEYEIKGIEVEGYPLKDESTEKYIKTAYVVHWEEMRFVFLGHISNLPPAELLENMSEPDVLFFPTGDDHFLSIKDATVLLKKLEPKIAIPGFYKNTTPALLKEIGKQGEAMEKLVFKKKELGDAKGRIVILEPKE